MFLKVSAFLSFIFIFRISSLEIGSVDLIKEFVVGRKLTSALLFFCPLKTQLDLMKLLMDMEVVTNVMSPRKASNDTMELAVDDTRATAFIIDLDCEGSASILQKASKAKYFGILHHWLIFARSDETVPSSVTNTESSLPPETAMKDSDNQSTEVTVKYQVLSQDAYSFPLPKKYLDICEDMKMSSISFQELHFLEAYVDSQVLVAVPSTEEQFLLYDIFKTGPGEHLIVNLPQTWTRDSTQVPMLTRGYSKSQRKNYGGIVINTGMVLVYTKSMDDVGDMRYKHLDMWNKMNYEYIRLVSEILNFRPNVMLVRSWGYWRNGVFDGVVGLLQTGKAEIGAVGLAIKKRRWDVLDYAADTTEFKGPRFLFRQPSLSSVTNIFTLPFERTVWFACCALIFVITVLLFLVLYMENKDVQEENVKSQESFSDVALTAFGAICQQGSTIEPKKGSSRILFLFLFVLSVFLFTSYSACIVSLLQTSSSAIRTLNDLLHGPHQMAFQDILYNRMYPNETSNELVQGLYKKSKGFLSLPDGVEVLRRKLFAFHVDVSGAYKLMGEYFQEHEKCGFKELQLYPYTVLGVPVKKRSPYKEHVAQSLRWLKEVGIISREFRRRVTQKPICSGSSSGFISVGIVDFYPAILVYLTGILCSVVVLLLEILYHKRKMYHERNHPEHHLGSYGDINIRRFIH